MNKGKQLQLLLGACFSLPIWYYLLYQVLDRVGASDLMWFLYWVYVPVGVVGALLGAIAES